MESSPVDTGRMPGDGSRPLIVGRRCYLTVLFCDLCDSTALSASLEAEDYAEILGGLRRLYETVVAKHGGSIVRVQGDGMLAVFGYPHPREGDGRCAAEAALDLHSLIRDTGPAGLGSRWPKLRLHSGIHSGLVLVQQGDMVLGRLELLGNVPNIASRLSDAAARDEIIVSEETLGPESSFFETSPRRLVPIAGRDKPIAAYTILGRTLVRNRFEARAQRGLPMFIGRKAELDLLAGWLEESLAGAVRHVAAVAPAGVGKTRLAQEFLATAAQRGCLVFRGYCESYLSAEPLQPLLQMLRSLFGLTHDMPAAVASEAVMSCLGELGLQDHGPELLRALSVASEKSADPRPAAPESTMVAVKALFARLVQQDPLVLFIDDWQWVDAATTQVLAALQALEGVALFVLVATRGIEPGDATMNEARVIELQPFSPQEAAQSIGVLLPRADPFVAAEISRYSGGNQLFIEELCHSAAHEDMDRRLVRLHGGAAWLNVLIESRVARLSEAQAELVRTAAVVGVVVPTWLLQDLTGCAEDHPLVRGLATEDFLFPGEAPGTLRFKHGITRDVIYESVGLRARKGLHLRIADALRRRLGPQNEAYEALAYHYGASDHLVDAAHYAEMAGDKAVAVSALDRAKAQYRAALAALDAIELTEPLRVRWLRIADKLGLVCVFDADRHDTQTFRRAVALAHEVGDPKAIGRAEHWLGYIHYGLGETRAAIRHCELALDAMQGLDADPLAVQIRATLGQARTAACDYAAALPLLDEAIAIKRRHRSGSRPAVGLAFSLVCRSWVLGDRGDFTAAHECLDEAYAGVGPIVHEIRASIQGWRAALLLWQGRWLEASEAAAESTHVAEQTRSLFQFCMGRAIVAYAQWRLTQDPQAVLSLQQATAWLEPRESGLFRSLNHGWLAEGLLTLGQRQEARHHAAKALVRGRRADLIGVCTAYRALARDAASQQQSGRTLHYIGQAMKVAQRRGSAHEVASTQLCEAELACALGDAGRARLLLDRVMPAFERMQMAWHLGEATRLLSRV